MLAKGERPRPDEVEYGRFLHKNSLLIGSHELAAQSVRPETRACCPAYLPYPLPLPLECRQ